jgi:hypothetical protein
MLFIHKKSPTPITHWEALRHGGLNNLDAGIKGKFLVLCNVDIVHREGAWNYLFEFDVRDDLEIRALAQLVGKAQRYPNDMDWKKWLGPDCHVITAKVREAILNMPADEAHTDAVITGMREVPNARPIPGRDPSKWFQLDLPSDFALALPPGSEPAREAPKLAGPAPSEPEREPNAKREALPKREQMPAPGNEGRKPMALASAPAHRVPQLPEIS